jgi:hypothetical protein
MYSSARVIMIREYCSNDWEAVREIYHLAPCSGASGAWLEDAANAPAIPFQCATSPYIEAPIDRQRGAGWIPPVCTRIPCTDERLRLNNWAI